MAYSFEREDKVWAWESSYLFPSYSTNAPRFLLVLACGLLSLSTHPQLGHFVLVPSAPKSLFRHSRQKMWSHGSFLGSCIWLRLLIQKAHVGPEEAMLLTRIYGDW